MACDYSMHCADELGILTNQAWLLNHRDDLPRVKHVDDRYTAQHNPVGIKSRGSRVTYQDRSPCLLEGRYERHYAAIYYYIKNYTPLLPSPSYAAT